MERKLLWILLFGLLLKCSLGFPRADDSNSKSSSSESNEGDTQQQQIVDTEDLGDFTKKIKTPRRPNVNEKLKEVQDLDDPCLDPKKTGLCKAAVPRFFLNKAEGKCEFFIFGGCGANRNNFKALSDCETTCAKHLKKDLTPKADAEDICSLSALINPNGVQCQAYMPRWTYNSGTEKCEEFIYGGCGGSRNIFRDKVQCESTCGKNKMLEIIPNVETDDVITTASESCNLPMDKGLCYAIKYKYFFNKEDNRCEKFEYGGCGGNSNRFNSAEECIRTCGGDVPAHVPECANVDCPWELYTHYTTLDCKPIYDAQACCPTRFECPNKQESNNTIEGARSLTLEPEPLEPKCSYKGKSYNIGEDVTEASVTGSCRAGCICTKGWNPNEGGKITCASIECPEQLNGPPPGKEDCVPLYKRGSCCAYDFFCPNSTLTIIESQTPEESQTTENFKCDVDGQGYFEGQRFYPKKFPCLKCICQKGFNGTMSDQFCENIDCGIEIYYSHYLAKGCAPVYFQSEDGTSSCCPISWECPDEQTERPPTTTTMPLEPVPSRPVGPVPVGPSPVTTEASVTVPIPPKPHRSGRQVSVEACQLPKEVGNCKARRPRFFHNNETGTCEQFTYSGCRGNDNNFVSLQDCQRLCLASNPDNRGLLRSLDSNQQQQEPQPRAIYVTEVDPCTMPKKQGNCKGFFPRFYYSPEDNSCQTFIFGGCQGGGNNFYTRESCEATCSNSISTENLRTNVLSSGSSGDSSTVNFGEDVPVSSSSSSSKSIGIHVDPCSLPKKTGNCKASIRRFHYDYSSKQCQEFVYGGCGGNDNNFLSLWDCEKRCKVQETPRMRSQIQVQPAEGSPQESSSGYRRPQQSFVERCRLPRQSGSCLGIRPSYYFDADNGTCNLFFYSGCFGNANRFSSVEDCESTCKSPDTSTTNGNNEGIGGRMMSPNSSWRSSVTSTDEVSGNSRLPPKVSATRPRPSSGNTDSKDENDKDMCKMAPDAGRGKAYDRRYHWNSDTKQCLIFVYFGTRGNKNNFLTESDCLSACGEQPTIEQLTSEGLLSCSFGNETLPLGATVGGHRYSSDEIPCGVPVCQCLTPPSVTCVQTMCPTPAPVPVTEKICPIPSCGPNCDQVIGSDGCSTCDCDKHDDDSQQVQVQEPEEVFIKSVKG